MGAYAIAGSTSAAYNPYVIRVRYSTNGYCVKEIYFWLLKALSSLFGNGSGSIIGTCAVAKSATIFICLLSQSDTESEEEESDVESESEEEEQQAPAPAGPASKYMRGGDSDSDSDDDGKRVVRSARDKRFDELQQTYDQMKNQMKINDWVSLQSSFEKLNKQLEKVARLTEGEPTPRLYIKAVSELEDFMVGG